MLPNNVIDAVVEGNLGGETVKMEIDATATAHLMSVMTDLYSDRIMAFIREYATNARDAHIEAGTNRPIEITLPSRMESYYRVKDYGIGLDIDGIKNIYSKYGSSTKRGSNDFNGMLGLGCKSAMTYAAQFSIVSVKDGVKYNVAVSRGLDGVGEMQVIDALPTDEGNGVEIVIPIKSSDHWTVKAKVAEFFQWWPVNSVLVNGVAPVRFTGREVEKNIYMVDGMEKDVIVMGNVAYPLPEGYSLWDAEVDRWGYSRKDFAVAYFAGMGEVTFAPNREALQTSKNTRDTIERVRAEFQKNLMETLQKEINDSSTHSIAAALFLKFQSRYKTLDLNGLTYNGEAFPTQGIEAPFTMVTPAATASQQLRGETPKPVKNYKYFHSYDANGGSKEGRHSSISMEKFSHINLHSVFVVNAPMDLNSGHRTKMRRAYEGDIIPKYSVWLTSDSKVPGGKWLADVSVIDWATIRDFKDTSASVSDPTIHTVVELDGSESKRQVPDDEKIVYASPSLFSGRWTNYKSSMVYRPAIELGYTFVMLSANRHAKFKREHPNALTDDEILTMHRDNFVNGLSSEEKEIIGTRSEDIARLQALAQHVDITNTHVLALAKKASTENKSALDRRVYDMSNRLHYTNVKAPEFKEVSPLADYPLLDFIPSRDFKSHAEHIAAYMTAVDNGKKGN